VHTGSRRRRRGCGDVGEDLWLVCCAQRCRSAAATASAADPVKAARRVLPMALHSSIGRGLQLFKGLAWQPARDRTGIRRWNAGDAGCLCFKRHAEVDLEIDGTPSHPTICCSDAISPKIRADVRTQHIERWHAWMSTEAITIRMWLHHLRQGSIPVLCCCSSQTGQVNSSWLSCQRGSSQTTWEMKRVPRGHSSLDSCERQQAAPGNHRVLHSQ
jgi:hypothetical protein